MFAAIIDPSTLRITFAELEDDDKLSHIEVSKLMHYSISTYCYSNAYSRLMLKRLLLWVIPPLIDFLLSKIFLDDLISCALCM